MNESSEPSYLEKIFNNLKNTTMSAYDTIRNQTMSLKQQYWNKTGGNHKRKHKVKKGMNNKTKSTKRNKTKRFTKKY